MAQATNLAAGTSATTGSDITVAAGSVVSVGLFSASVIPPGYLFPIMMDTPSADVKVGDLSEARPAMQLPGPGTFRVKRPDLTAAAISVGIFTET